MKQIDGAQLAERVANAVGSWRFIMAQGVVLLLWVLINTTAAALRWDGYPFVFLNLAMSAEAAFTGPVLLIAANVSAGRDRAQAARIEQLEKTLDDHVNVTARNHTAELRANTILTREIHAAVVTVRVNGGGVAEGVKNGSTAELPDAQPARRANAGRAARRKQVRELPTV